MADRVITKQESNTFARAIEKRLPEPVPLLTNAEIEALSASLSDPEFKEILKPAASELGSFSTHKIGRLVVTLNYVLGDDIHPSEYEACVESVTELEGGQIEERLERYRVVDGEEPEHKVILRPAHVEETTYDQELFVKASQLSKYLGYDLFWASALQDILGIIAQCNDSNRLE